MASKQVSPQSCAQMFKRQLALDMLATGRGEMIPQALPLLGPQKLNSYNEQVLVELN